MEMSLWVGRVGCLHGKASKEGPDDGLGASQTTHEPSLMSRLHTASEGGHQALIQAGAGVGKPTQSYDSNFPANSMLFSQ